MNTTFKQIGNIKYGYFKRFPNPPELALIPFFGGTILVSIGFIIQSNILSTIGGVGFIISLICFGIDNHVSHTWIETTNGEITYSGKFREHFGEVFDPQCNWCGDKFTTWEEVGIHCREHNYHNHMLSTKTEEKK